MWVGIVWVGAVMAAVTLLALDLRLPGGIVGDSGNVVEARTMAFTTLVLAQLFNCLQRPLRPHERLPPAVHQPVPLGGDRDFRRCSRSRSWSCRSSTTPFGTAPLGLDEWLICIGLASVVLWADEAKKLVERRLWHRAIGRGGERTA